MAKIKTDQCVITITENANTANVQTIFEVRRVYDTDEENTAAKQNIINKYMSAHPDTTVTVE